VRKRESTTATTVTIDRAAGESERERMRRVRGLRSALLQQLITLDYWEYNGRSVSLVYFVVQVVSRATEGVVIT